MVSNTVKVVGGLVGGIILISALSPTQEEKVLGGGGGGLFGFPLRESAGGTTSPTSETFDIIPNLSESTAPTGISSSQTSTPTSSSSSSSRPSNVFNQISRKTPTPPTPIENALNQSLARESDFSPTPNFTPVPQKSTSLRTQPTQRSSFFRRFF